MRWPAMDTTTRFLRYVEKQAGDCWIWTGHRDRQGYGRFKIHDESKLAHRVSYELFVGEPISSNLVIDHLCRTPACVNPAHMEVVTHEVNTLRGDSPPAANARKSTCVNGHPFNEANTYTKPENGHRSCRACNREAVARYKSRKRMAA